MTASVSAASVPSSADERENVHSAARRARVASRALALLTTAERIRCCMPRPTPCWPQRSRCSQPTPPTSRSPALRNGRGLLDRLRLTAPRIDGIAAGLRQVAGLPDPIGEVIRGSTLPNGLEIRQMRVPLGVVGMVYEARPNVTVDAFGLAFKSGNAVLLRGPRPRRSRTQPWSRRCRVRSRATGCRNRPYNCSAVLIGRRSPTSFRPAGWWMS